MSATMDKQRAMGTRILCAGFMLMSLLASCRAAPGTELAQVNGTQTCRAYTTEGRLFPCSDHTIFNEANADSTDPRQRVCCLRELTVTLKVASHTAILSDTVIYTATITNVQTAPVDVTGVTGLHSSALQIQKPLPAGCKVTSTDSADLTCSPFTLAPGETKTLVIAIRVEGLSALKVGMRLFVSTDENGIYNAYSDYAGLNVKLSCSKYFSFGAAPEPFSCPQGTVFDEAQANNTRPSIRNCCSRGACCERNGRCTQGPRSSCSASKTYHRAVTCEQAIAQGLVGCTELRAEG